MVVGVCKIIVGESCPSVSPRRCCGQNCVCRFCLPCSFRRASAACVLWRYATRLQRRADTCIAHNMQQARRTAPPIPPPPLSQSLPEPSLIPGSYVAGGEGLHAPLEQHGYVQPRQRGQRKSARESKHQQNTARQYACTRTMHTEQCIQHDNIACRTCGTKQAVLWAQVDLLM